MSQSHTSPQSALGREISALSPALLVADDVYTLRTYSKDLWPRNLILSREGELPKTTVDAVVWPANIEVLAQFVRKANEKGWVLYPYGAGSGVCGAATPELEGHTRPRVVVDLKRMDAVESIDEVS